MRSLLFITALLIILCCLSVDASAQIRLRSWVMANGGGTCVCTSHRTDCTLGEPLTGSAAGTSEKQGAGFWGAVGTSPATGVERVPDVPLQYSLEHNYPNPFNPSTTITCTLPVAGHLKLSVFDILGEEVAVLLNDMREAGTITVTWDAAGFPSGMYICRMNAPGYTSTRKMVLLR
jgi:hypothetical protein